SQVGLLGEPYLELRAGRPGAPELPAGGTLATEEAATLQDAIARAGNFLDSAGGLIGRLDRLAAAAPLDRLDSTLVRLDRLVTTATKGSANAFTQVNRTSEQLERLAERSTRLIVSIDTIVRTTAPGVSTTQKEALTTLRELRGLINELRVAVDQGQGVG